MIWIPWFCRSPSSASWSKMMAAVTFIIADTRYAIWTLALCPVEYWDRPSRRCAEPLVVALQLQQSYLDSGNVPVIGGSTASHYHRQQSPVGATELRNISKTCLGWDRTNACYQQLIRECVHDQMAVTVLKAHLRRYFVYSQTCQERSQRNQQLADCFLAYFTPTQTCSEAFDRYFRGFVVDKQYSNACRVVSSALKCFHDLTRKVAVGRCGSDGAAEYQRNYIRPLVDQSRETVTTRCTLQPPYDLDFVSGAAPLTPRHVSAAELLQRRKSSNSSPTFAFVSSAILSIIAHAPVLAVPVLLSVVQRRSTVVMMSDDVVQRRISARGGSCDDVIVSVHIEKHLNASAAAAATTGNHVRSPHSLATPTSVTSIVSSLGDRHC